MKATLFTAWPGSLLRSTATAAATITAVATHASDAYEPVYPTATLNEGSAHSARNQTVSSDRPASHLAVRLLPSKRKILRILNCFVVLSMLLSLVSGWAPPASAAAPSGVGSSGSGSSSGSRTTSGNPMPPAPQQRTVAPYVDPHLPSIVLDIEASPYQVAVGDVFTVTVTVRNQAPDPASNLQVTLPLPAGAANEGFGGGTVTPFPTANPSTTAVATGVGTTVSTAVSTVFAPKRPNLPKAPSGSIPSNGGKVPFIPGTTTANPDPSSTPISTAFASSTAVESPTSNPSYTPTQVPTGTPTETPTGNPTGILTASATPDPNGWTWQQVSMPGNSTVTYTAQMRLMQAPASGAVPVQVQATADGLSVPVVGTGGAIVVQRNLGAATVPFVPGTPALLHSLDGMVTVQFPANAYTQPLTLQHAIQHGAGNIQPPDVAGRKRGLGTFFLNATDTSGQQVHQFSAPITITVSYSPEQLQALGISEAEASLFWYDENHQGGPQWVPVDSAVDDVHHTLTATVNHFTPFTLSDGSSPSAEFVPSLQGWQVGLYTGDVSYQFPIDVPAGPGGIKPNISLSYSSTSTDGDTGTRQKQQSSWVGKGWSLDTGYVALNRLTAESDVSRYYTLVFNGQSFDLVRGEPRVASPNLSNPQDWEWHPTNESFIRARAEVQSDLAGRGGPGFTRHMWKVWAKDGTRYDFMEDAWQGFTQCPTTHSFLETYKWYLSRVVDTHRNVITYNYNRATEAVPAHCDTVSGTIDYSVWPTSITWGSNSVTGSTDRYKVEFVSQPRSIDTDFDRSAGSLGRAPQETQQLTDIKISSDPSLNGSGAWQLVRQYRLNYETNAANYLLSDYSDGSNLPDTTHPKLTLKGITRLGSDGTTALPDITFTYGLTRGTGYYPNGNWNRLITVNNGQGGTLAFTYANIGQVLSDAGQLSATLFRNFRRVTGKTVTDGMGGSYPWTYAYQNPALNTLGSTLINGQEGPNQYPNSADVYFNVYYNSIDNSGVLVHKKKKEFRGHGYATETDPNGNVTEHWFYQGDATGLTDGNGNTCNYPGYPGAAVQGGGIENNACFQVLRKQEFLKGKEYDTVVHSGSSTGPKLSETKHAYTVNFLGNGWDTYADDRLTGLWRASSYENQTIDTSWEGGVNPLNHITTYEYTDSYGNLTAQEERDTNNTVLRRTEHSYTSNISADGYYYIVDRKRSDNVFVDTNHAWLARTVYAYDGSYGTGSMTIGDLTLVRKYYNLTVPPSTTLPDPAYSNDTSYTYDAYGNQTSVSTYSLQGQLTGGGTVWSAPGCSTSSGCGTARTTTTIYEPQNTTPARTTTDPPFHSFPLQIDPPAVNGVTLRQQGYYDYRMGLVTSVTDPNGNQTSQQYDAFGRWTQLLKPGDQLNIPTAFVNYYDNELPVRYLVGKREQLNNSGAFRTEQHYYNGLGQEIQTKAQSLINCGQNIVTDKKYDGLGQAIQQSTPRYVGGSGCIGGGTFYAYTPLDTAAVEKWTTTSYDTLGRATSVVSPDNTLSSMQYAVTLDAGAYVLATSSIDQKLHKTTQMSDVFGRLIRVIEYSGTGTTGDQYAPYATTNYTYSRLDLLTTVAMQGGATTTISYDSLGRKTSMQDATMGTWLYGYDVNGNLKTQQDAKNQQISFGYDALDRLISKTYPDASTVQYTYDGAGSSNGKGQRTSMSKSTAGGSITTSWQYDTRGRQTQAVYSIPGLSGTGSRTVSTTYDAANRIDTMTYPTGEVLTYTYDAAWHQQSVCSSLGGCYANSATYTALDQPLSYTMGNSVVQSYSYDATMQRLWQVQATNGATTLYKRSYYYDYAGNVQENDNNVTGETQSYLYDHRDRLTNWALTPSGGKTTNTAYTYDELGNITNKGGTAYTYGAGNGGPHAVRTVGGLNYSYDADGNTTNDSKYTYTWNYDNQPSQIASMTYNETYQYDGDNERVSKVAGSGLSSSTTYYIGGVYEEDAPSGVTRSLYTFNGQVVAQRTVDPAGGGSGPGAGPDAGKRPIGVPAGPAPLTAATTIVYLHGDQLGSVSLVSSSSGTVASQQDYDPWGKVRSGGVTQTTLNYTGQKLDGTGLLYYHARYYDPVLGRFTSADSVVPKTENSSLTTDLHEKEFVSALNKENEGVLRNGFWSDYRHPDGPANPSQLNRYSYALNNPIRYNDATGHCPWCIVGAVVGAIAGGVLGAMACSQCDTGTKVAAILGGAAVGALVGSGVGCLVTTACAAAAGALLSGSSAGVAAAANRMATYTQATVARKLLTYLLDPTHPDGGPKAKWFQQALGFTKDNYQDLAKQLVFDPSKATVFQTNQQGTIYNQVITIVGANGRVIDVLTSWIILRDGSINFVTVPRIPSP